MSAMSKRASASVATSDHERRGLLETEHWDEKGAAFEVVSSGEAFAKDLLRGQSTLHWEYDLQITCPGIPRTDALVIDVLSPDGSRISRFSKRLWLQVAGQKRGLHNCLL